ncbi:TPA: hypothetical protein NJN57_001173 [Vibrio cholerae]|uniref:Uncharacterized protein n=2 Tax=Vibrio cholerae TaxID=666 RepID=M1RZD4_VIBCE|nr:hypothetical protein [Vibrio cholerae]AGG36633.1 hypothetical protein [Vibrio cholerae O1 biovar El Tor]KWW49599.1 hypothetical protein AVW04_13680 [Vibrio cholerae O1 biovar El Tor]HAS3326877.1 hypothetical protein [Vibrio cholerae]HAS3336363.1 hypothetical protein [Vibrio cholerae]HCG1784432.1 hypothetical protein [Vibrio cholerae]
MLKPLPIQSSTQGRVTKRKEINVLCAEVTQEKIAAVDKIKGKIPKMIKQLQDIIDHPDTTDSNIMKAIAQLTAMLERWESDLTKIKNDEEYLDTTTEQQQQQQPTTTRKNSSTVDIMALLEKDGK